MKKFNKLVRDKIPEIIMKNGEKPTIRILTDEEYMKELNKKLREEVNEYLTDENIEELADVEEVIRAIMYAKGKKIEELEEIRRIKGEKKGTYKDKVFLEYTKK